MLIQPRSHKRHTASPLFLAGVPYFVIASLRNVDDQVACLHLYVAETQRFLSRAPSTAPRSRRETHIWMGGRGVEQCSRVERAVHDLGLSHTPYAFNLVLIGKRPPAAAPVRGERLDTSIR